ncbi:efflux RND transporter periplasmic adaptor subunit [Foetidibacter luteolus]|uniref:efflux RND transporter periplasmic adaptor subunit n=1 Tax=Foetidibacter luteolus TaxID=2608880 RepID=UPI00129A338A|nr:efflux RND transporter periplasmic adaptor subunit [Foetidibacter luteolus]
MQRFLNILVVTAVVTTLASCGAAKDKNAAVAEKKADLDALKKEQASLTDKIAKLEAEIAKLDPASAKQEKAKLVSIDTITPGSFTHFIDLQGKVDAQNIAFVTPQNQGGQVKELYVKQGDYVKKGQLLMKLDNEAFKTQLGPLQVQLDNAKDILRRRQNLWEQGIGTEVELISARTTVSNLQKQIDAVNTQIGQYNVYSPMNGVAETVNIRVGETFSPATANVMGIKLVNTGDLKLTANVPEVYLDKVNEGTSVMISLPDVNKNISARVTVKGKIVDPNSRSFYIEAKLPADKDLRPNQLAVVKIQDYAAANAITVPVNTLQTDEKGKFVMVAAKEGNKLIARKRTVMEGQMYTDTLEIKSGLQQGDAIIVDGFQGLYEGQLITTDAK